MSTLARPRAQITTFYSYKGGTGRTMLLANVAWILATAGKRVLAIDWDLEAPGLHHYLHPFLIDPRLEATDGLIDMVVEYSREAVTPDEQSSDRNWLDHAADVRRFVAGVNWTFPNNGLLHLLPAGRQNASFSVRVNTFHWDDFYERLNGGAFLELVKVKIQNDYEYDHILIDSRTGVSDTSGICTVQMPDRLVVCFTASEQSIKGSATVASSTWAQWARLKDSDRDGKTDASQERRIFPILMRIEASEKEKLDAARARVRQVFGALPGLSEYADDYWNKAEVGYWPYYAFEEVLAVFGDRFRSESSLLAACEHVADLITDGAVNRLTPPESDQRNQVLAAYERCHGVTTQRVSAATAMAKIFVSYDRANKDVVEELVEDLRADDRDVWFDQNLTGGQRWWNDILSKIRECEIFVAALTPDFLGSQRCQRETKYATNLQRRLLPVRLSNAVSTDSIPPDLGELQWVDYTLPDKYALRNLQRTLRHLPQAPPLPDPLPEPPAVPISYLSQLTEMIDSDDQLRRQEQIQLVFELRQQVRNGQPPSEIIELLQRLKRRDDLFARVMPDIDDLMREIDEGRGGGEVKPTFTPP